MTNDRDLDTTVRTWLDEPPPGPPDRDAVHARVMDRLPETHQRRHWWPIQWNPFAAGATRSADANGPHPAERSRTMFNATRIVAAAAVLALGGSLAFVAAPLGPSEEPVVPASSASTVDDQMMAPASIRATYLWGLDGDNNGEEVGDFLRGRIGKMWAIDDPDPRLDGTARFVHDARDDGGLGPQWGTFRLETEEGAWEGTMSGFWDRHETRTSGWLRGEGAYDGLTMYLQSSIDHAGAPAEMIGIIVPGDPPSDPPTFD